MEVYDCQIILIEGSGVLPPMSPLQSEHSESDANKEDPERRPATGYTDESKLILFYHPQ